jgi:hypothetical protein
MRNILKRILVFGAVSLSYFIPQSAFSQTTVIKADSSHSFVKPHIKINKWYTKEELNALPKLDLIEIYKSRLVYLVEVLPFLSLHPAPGSTFHDMSIPETPENISHLEKETKNKQAFVGSLFETLDDVIPYSEKSNIIWCILFFDEMIKKSDYVGFSTKKK